MASLLQLAEGRGGDLRAGALLPEAGASQGEQRGEGVGAAIAAARLDEPGEEEWAPPHGIGGVGLRGGGIGGGGMGADGLGDGGLARGTRQAGSGVWHARRNQSGARRLAEAGGRLAEGGGPWQGEGARGAARAAAAGTWDDLDLEDAYANKISYNIGVLFMYRHAAARLELLMGAWASAVVGDEPGQGAQRWGGKQRGKQMGRSPPPRSSWWGGAPRKVETYEPEPEPEP